MMKKQKAKAIAAKCHRNRRGNCLSNREKKNQNSDITNDIDLDQAESKYWVIKLNGGETTSD